MERTPEVTVYEKPTCTKCRQVKRILTEKGIEFESVDYTKEPLSPSELKRLLQSAGLKPQEALRKNEDAYHQYVADKNLTDQQLIRVMTEHPELIQRPIVARGGKVVLARPLDRLAELGIEQTPIHPRLENFRPNRKGKMVVQFSDEHPEPIPTNANPS